MDRRHVDGVTVRRRGHDVKSGARRRRRDDTVELESDSSGAAGRRGNRRQHARVRFGRHRTPSAQRHQLLPRVTGSGRFIRLARSDALLHCSRVHRSVCVLFAYLTSIYDWRSRCVELIACNRFSLICKITRLTLTVLISFT